MDPDDTRVEVPARARCFGCDYRLHALEGNRCPECGREFDPARPETMNLAGRPIGLYRRLGVFPFWPVVLLVVGYLGLAVFLQRTPDPLPYGWREVPWYVLFAIQGLVIGLILLRRRYQAVFRPPADLFRPAGKRPVVLFLLVVLAYYLTEPRILFRIRAWVSLPSVAALADEVQETPWAVGQVRSAGLLRISNGCAAPGLVAMQLEGSQWWIVRSDAGGRPPMLQMPVFRLSPSWHAGFVSPDEILRLQVNAVARMAHGEVALDQRIIPTCIALLREHQFTVPGPSNGYVAMGSGEGLCSFGRGLCPAEGVTFTARYMDPALPWGGRRGEIRPEIVVLAKLGPAAVPKMRELVASPAARAGTRCRAAGVLALMGKDAAAAVPDLQMLVAVQGASDMAAAALGCIGPEAAGAADALCMKLTDRDPIVVHCAAAALAMVAPQAELSDGAVEMVVQALSRTHGQPQDMGIRMELLRAVGQLPAPPVKLLEAAVDASRDLRKLNADSYERAVAAPTQGVELVREMALRHPAARPAATRMLLDLLIAPDAVRRPAEMRFAAVLAEIAPDDPVVTACLAERVRYYRDGAYWRKLLRIYAPNHPLVDDRRLANDAERYLEDLRGNRVYGNNSDVELWRLAVAQIPWADGRGGISVEAQERVRELACKKLGVADRDELIGRLVTRVAPQRYFSWESEATTILAILGTAPDRAELILPVLRLRVQRYTQGYDGVHHGSPDQFSALCKAIGALGPQGRPLLPDLAEFYLRQAHTLRMVPPGCEEVLIRLLASQQEVPAEVIAHVEAAMAAGEEVTSENAARLGAMLGMKVPPEEWLREHHPKLRLAVECAMLSGWNMPTATALMSRDDAYDNYNSDDRLTMLVQIGRCPPALAEQYLLSRLDYAGVKGRLGALDALEQRQPLSESAGAVLRRHAELDPNGEIRERCGALLRGMATTQPAGR